MRGFSSTRVNRVAALVVADLALQVLIIVLGLFAFFDLDLLLDSIDLGRYPTWDELIFALGVATVIFTGLESAAGLVRRGGGRAARPQAPAGLLARRRP